MSHFFSTPPLSVLNAHLLAGAFGSSFVGSLYVSQNTRITYTASSSGEQARERERRRDDPDVIRARVVATLGGVVYNGRQEETNSNRELVCADNGTTNPLGTGFGLVHGN